MIVVISPCASWGRPRLWTSSGNSEPSKSMASRPCEFVCGSKDMTKLESSYHNQCICTKNRNLEMFKFPQSALNSRSFPLCGSFGGWLTSTSSRRLWRRIHRRDLFYLNVSKSRDTSDRPTAWRTFRNPQIYTHKDDHLCEVFDEL